MMTSTDALVAMLEGGVVVLSGNRNMSVMDAVVLDDDDNDDTVVRRWNTVVRMIPGLGDTDCGSYLFSSS